MKKTPKSSRKNIPKTQTSLPDPILPDQWAWVLVGILMTLGFVLRIYRVDFLSMWTDEFIIPDRAAGFLDGKSLISTHENTGILLTLFVALFYKIFGVSDFVARSVSVLFGTLVIPLTFLLARRLFSTTVGVLSAVLTSFSLYSIYWARVCRNYASFEFFYLVMVLVFWLGFEATRSDDKGASWNKKQGLDWKILVLFFVAFVAAMLNHQLTFFFAFSVAFYGSLVAVTNIRARTADCWTSKYAWVLYPTVLFAFLFNTPVMAEYIIKPIAGLVLHEEGILWFIPRWDIIFGVWASPQKFRVLNIYLDVLKNDFPAIWWLAVPGFAAAVWLRKREGIFLLSAFLIPFLLMCFVFYDPAASRYMLYLYPFYCIAIAAALYALLVFVSRYVVAKLGPSTGRMQYAAIFCIVAAAVYFSPLKEVQALVTVQHHGVVSKQEISNWYFSNWREAGENMKARLKKSDIVFSTMPSGTNHYLGIDSSLWFRQMHYSEYVKKYISNEPIDTREPNATTFENFLQTIERYDRGWVFADYYFYNVMTDPRAREHVIRYLRYHYDACSDGTVQVFSWDKNNPEPPKATFVELGKRPEAVASQPFTLRMESVDSSRKVILVLDCEAIDHGREGFVVINGKHSGFLNPCRSAGREFVQTELEPAWFVPGDNTLQFAYNQQSGGDSRRGFAIYNISIGQ